MATSKTNDKSKAKTKVSIHRYSDPGGAAGWDGYVEDDRRSWILYFDSEGNAQFFARRDDDGAVIDGEGVPPWATMENACIAARAVIRCGGTRERAAAAFRSTLMGIGEPAAAIDTASMRNAWDKAVDGNGPILVWAGMPDPSHASTEDPIDVNSPLIQLALLAVDMGVSPSRLVFSRTTKDCAPVGHGQDAQQATEKQVAPSAAFVCGEGGSDMSWVLCPRVAFSWCSLNGRFFPDWIGHGGESVRYDGCDMLPEARTVFTPDKPGHAEALRRIRDHFLIDGYADAAARVQAIVG